MIKIKNYEEVKEEVRKHLRDYLEIKGIKLKGRNFNSFCHNDDNASAGLTDDGRGFKCFACDIKGDIFTAYSIIEGISIDGENFFKALKDLADILGITYQLQKEYEPRLVKEKDYIYYDENSVMAYKISRYHKEDEEGNIILKQNQKIEKSFRAYTMVDNDWELGMKRDKRYLYNLPNVLQAKCNNEEIFMVEGEKCVEILEKEFGVTATTIPFGSNAWKEPYITQYKEQLKGSKLILIPDNDNSGYKLMDEIAGDIKRILKSLKVINLNKDTDLPEGGDVEDWIKKGGTKERLLKLMEEAKELSENSRSWYYTDDKGKTKVITGLLANHLIEDVPALNCKGDLYLYKNGVYKLCDRYEIQSIIKSKIDNIHAKMNIIKDVRGLWMADNRIITSPDELNRDANLINLQNGILNIETGEMLKHNMKYKITIQYNVKLNKDAKGELFHKFLNRVVPEAEKQHLLQEIAGYAMSSYNNAKKFFVFQGPHDTGKTTFLNLITSIIGKEHVSHVEMQDLSNSNYKSRLLGKILNVASELPDKGLSDVSSIKGLIGQDTLQIKRLYEDPFDFDNKAKLIFACNNMPINYGDKSEDFYKKLIVVKFNEVLLDDEIDITVPKKLQEEHEYVFLWAMEGLKRLIDNGFKFSETKGSKETVQEFKVFSNSVLSFVAECCEIDKEAEVVSSILYENYNDYCRQSNYKPIGRNKFKLEIEKEFVGKVTTKLVTADRLSGYAGIRLK